MECVKSLILKLHLELLVILISMHLFTAFAKQVACDFNKRCFCSNPMDILAEVTCIGVPMVQLEQFPAMHYYRIKIKGAGDMRLPSSDSFNNISISSLTITKTRLSTIEASAFANFGPLTALELTQTNIKEFPSEALSPLKQLQWLNLRGNKIESLNGKDFRDIVLLKSLLLSDNFISVVRDQTFKDVTSLDYLDLDNNLITRIEGTPFPSSLTTLSIANCLLQEVNSEAIANLRNIKFLNLRGNLIANLSTVRLPTNDLESLDLSHNLIQSIVFAARETSNTIPNPLKASLNPASPFGQTLKANTSRSSLHIRDLHLDFNFIQSLPSGSFRHISVEHLSLSNNRITSELIDSDAFVGPLQWSLQVLDLNYNLMQLYPEALIRLRGIKQLLLKNNQLKNISNASFYQMQYLELLDLSKNLLKAVPLLALQTSHQLIKLNLQENRISKINYNDFDKWSKSLRYLNLGKNQIRIIEPNAFKHAKSLRELRLSGNDIKYLTGETLTSIVGLEMLELSNSLDFHTATSLIQSSSSGFDSLKWLQMDNINLREFRSNSLDNFKSLVYLDLEGNQINTIEPKLLKENFNLTTIVLNRNYLKTVDSEAFSNLPQLENVALYFNRLETIESKAFSNLPKLRTVLISKNRISQIKDGAFFNISNSMAELHIFLNENQLKTFSLLMFDYPAQGPKSMFINASVNSINKLVPFGAFKKPTNEIRNSTLDHRPKQTLNIRVLDLSHNLISDFPPEFAETICQSLEALYLQNNALTNMPIKALQHCNELQILILDHNFINETETEQLKSTVPINFGVDLTVLSLKHNKISQLRQFSSIFLALKNLRVLDLSNNLIKMLPENAFYGTKLQRLLLSRNQLDHIAAEEQTLDRCFGVGETLLYLDLSFNHFNKLPFPVTSCDSLIELNFANNFIQELTDHDFLTFNYLLDLNLSNNPVKKVESKTFFKTLPNLETLNLRNTSLNAVPTFALSRLTSLDLSNNGISSISSSSFSKTRQIQWLDLSNNLLVDVPKNIWKYMTNLHYLNLNLNRWIEILDTTSFAELKKLRHLDMRGLSLQYIDTRVLHSHKYLTSIKTSTYPNIRSFRLHDLLAKLSALRSATIEVQESTLSHQIQWTFGSKLKELVITGPNLINIIPDAFLGFQHTHELTLRVTNTSITKLPNEMLRFLSGIRYMTIDLRKNKLRTLTPQVLMVAMKSDADSIGIDENQIQLVHLTGGILLDDNPLRCDCNLLWISDWLKKWISDAKVQNVETALQVNAIARQSSCSFYVNNSTDNTTKRISILDLKYEIDCQNASTTSNLNVAIVFILIIYYNFVKCF